MLQQEQLITYIKMVCFNFKMSEMLSRTEQPTAVGKMFYLFKNFLPPLNPSHPQRLGISCLCVTDRSDALRLVNKNREMTEFGLGLLFLIAQSQ